MLEDNQNLLNDQFMEALVGLIGQVDAAAAQGNTEAKALAEKLNSIYKAALKYSMQKNLREQNPQ